MSKSLILVTSYDGLMADGRRVAWQSFRPASAAAGSKPTVYFTTLAADPDAVGTTRYNLHTVGAQAAGHAVDVTVLAGAVELKLAGQTAQPLPVGTTVTVPAKGTGDAAELTFTGDTCSLRVVPQWVAAFETPVTKTTATAGEPGAGGAPEGDGDGGDDGHPPPPLPGNTGNN